MTFNTNLLEIRLKTDCSLNGQILLAYKGISSSHNFHDDKTCHTNAAYYKGTASTTNTGENCQPWSDTTVQTAKRFYPEKYTQAFLEENYCRHPFSDNSVPFSHPFCVNANNTVLACDVPSCQNSPCNGYQCLDGQCIPISKKCDGFPDCAMQDDEGNCASDRFPIFSRLSTRKKRSILETHNQVIKEEFSSITTVDHVYHFQLHLDKIGFFKVKSLIGTGCIKINDFQTCDTSDYIFITSKGSLVTIAAFGEFRFYEIELRITACYFKTSDSLITFENPSNQVDACVYEIILPNTYFPLMPRFLSGNIRRNNRLHPCPTDPLTGNSDPGCSNEPVCHDRFHLITQTDIGSSSIGIYDTGLFLKN